MLAGRTRVVLADDDVTLGPEAVEFDTRPVEILGLLGTQGVDPRPRGASPEDADHLVAARAARATIDAARLPLARCAS